MRMSVLSGANEETAGAGAGDASEDSLARATAGAVPGVERLDTVVLSTLPICTTIWAGEILMSVHPSIAAWPSWPCLATGGTPVPQTRPAEGTVVAPSL